MRSDRISFLLAFFHEFLPVEDPRRRVITTKAPAPTRSDAATMTSSRKGIQMSRLQGLEELAERDDEHDVEELPHELEAVIDMFSLPSMFEKEHINHRFEFVW